ncbi:MAG: RDD family protein [Burkholderiaceae bacterium]
MSAPDTDVELVDATLWRRFLCMGYECFLLVGPVMVLAFVYGVLVNQTDAAGDPNHWKAFGLQGVLMAALLLYFGWGWSRSRVTLPMQTLGLRVVDASTGGPVSLFRAIGRAALGSLFVFSGLWLLGAWLNKARRTPYDLILGTRLVYRPLI